MTYSFLQRLQKKGVYIFISLLFVNMLFLSSAQADSPLCTSSVDIILIIDRSGSMGGGKITDAINAAQDFIDLLNPAFHRVGLVTFSSDIDLNVDLTVDYFQVQSALALIETGGGTKITSAINTAHTQPSWQGGNTPSVVIFLTDGNPTSGDTAEQARTAAENAKNDGITFFTIALGNHANSDLLRKIASSPNYFFDPYTSNDLYAIYDNIAAGICCGNGVVEPNISEECDDGNINDYDGCSAMCKIDYADIGLRTFDANEVVPILTEKPGIESPLRISKEGFIYNIALVSVDDNAASGIRIQTSNGIMALRKITIPAIPSSYNPLFN